MVMISANFGQNHASPQGVAARIAGAPKRGAGAPRAGMRPRRCAKDRGLGALTSRCGVASKQKTLGTCSALRGTFVARLANIDILAAPRFAPSTILAATHARFIVLGTLISALIGRTTSGARSPRATRRRTERGRRRESRSAPHWAGCGTGAPPPRVA